jgi:uncharacterized protein (DUF58 family)
LTTAVQSSSANAVREQAESLAATLPPLQVAAERLASAVSLGVHGRRKAGMGETFWQFRRYGSEDPRALIDWRQSAKSQHLFVREREWEATEAVWFWRDGSPSMRFSSTKTIPSKIDRANLLALALASLLVRGGERVGLWAGGGLPSTGRVPLNRMAHGLLDLAPEDIALPPDAPATRSSQLVWLSDFLSPPEDVETCLRRLSHGGLSGHLVQIIDPAEDDFPFAGRTRFESITSRNGMTFGRAEAVRNAYRARFRSHCEAIRTIAHRLGWSHGVHRTDHRPEIALIALYTEVGGRQVKLRS